MTVSKGYRQWQTSARCDRGKPTALAALLAMLVWQTLAVPAHAQTPVEVARVERGTAPLLFNLTGSITAVRSARLSAATAGQVQSMHVDAGSHVTAEQPLLTLDDELANWQLKAAQADEQTAVLALGDAQRRLEEARALAPQQSIAESMIRDLEAEVATDEATLRRARAETGYRQAVLVRHRVVAPFDAVVSEKLTEVGEWVTPGQPVLALVATGSLRFEFPLTEDHRAMVTAGTPLRYWLGDDAQFGSGKVTTVIPVADPGARTFMVHAGPDTPDARMAPGMSVRAQLVLAQDENRLMVPRDAILAFADGRTTAWIIDGAPDALVAKKIELKIARFVGNFAEVTAGLQAGDRVIVKGNEALRDGQAVRIVGEQGP